MIKDKAWSLGNKNTSMLIVSCDKYVTVMQEVNNRFQRVQCTQNSMLSWQLFCKSKTTRVKNYLKSKKIPWGLGINIYTY